MPTILSQYSGIFYFMLVNAGSYIHGMEFLWVSTQHCYFCFVFFFKSPQAHLNESCCKCLGGQRMNEKWISFLPNTHLRADIIALWQELQMEV